MVEKPTAAEKVVANEKQPVVETPNAQPQSGTAAQTASVPQSGNAGQTAVVVPKIVSGPGH
jgi:hypothetical protein